jgi:hypothetical protein
MPRLSVVLANEDVVALQPCVQAERLPNLA